MNIRRREFLYGVTGFLGTNAFQLNSLANNNTYDAAILGAGLAGLNAARLLERKGLRIAASQIVNLICRFILGRKIKDYTSGIFVMNRSVLNKVVPISYGHGEFFIEFLYKAKQKDVKILEIPFTQPADKEGISKTAPNMFKFIYLSFFYITRIILSLVRRD